MALRYVELAVTVPAEAADAVGALLCDLGSPGLAVEDGAPSTRLLAYFPDDAGLPERLTALDAAVGRMSDHYPGLSAVRLERRTVDPDDYADAWKPHFHPVRVGRRLVVAPTWEEPAARPGERVLRLDPGMAFGTGTHATTALCLEAVEGMAAAGTRGIDVGTGSGILAIAGALAGASVVAIDRDPVAVRVAKENVLHNRVADRVDVRYAELADVLADRPPPFDWAVCNLTADGIVSLAALLAQSLAPGATVVASGIVPPRHREVAAALQGAGLRPLRHAVAGGWAAVWAARPSERRG